MKQPNNIPSAFLLFLLGLSVIFTSCKKEDDNDEEVKGFAVTTKAATSIGRGWVTLNGSVNADNKVCTISFDYDTSTEFKNSVSATPATVKGDTTRSVYVNLSGLEPGTEYFFRVKAEYTGGPTYGSEMSFKTTTPKSFNIVFNPGIAYGSVTDIDGNTYKTITAGTRTWMAENLRVTRFNDGTAIPFVPVALTWYSQSTPGYCWYNADSLGYGALYNWHTIGTKNVCPEGWHVPADAEWSLLAEHLGGEAAAGGKLKETGTTHWNVPNYGSTNESGFSALPGGYRNTGGTFFSIRQKGYWWSSTEVSATQAYYRALGYNYSNIDRTSTSKVSGFSVRCLKDN